MESQEAQGRPAGGDQLHRPLLGPAALTEGGRLLQRYFALGAQEGPQASVSLLYYDYVHWYVKALEALGKVDDPDAA